jgi:hypothetical protein
VADISSKESICLLRVRKRTAFWLLGALLSMLLAVGLSETGLRFLYPQDTLSPRWQFSAQYCTLPPAESTMVHERPHRWCFRYGINAYSYRGKALPISNHYDKPHVVVLGDSYSFGAGVNDGEEYSAVLQRELKGSADVVNLAVGGWGLTQEIRRYYEFGILYAPSVVVLQFSANDPRDNLKCPVARLEGGRFVFSDTREGIYRVKEYLSRSVIQKSQIYNLFRDAIYRILEERVVEQSRSLSAPSGTADDLADQQVYVQMLDAFVHDLNSRGVRVVFLSVNHQLTSFSLIEKSVRGLAAVGLLTYHDAAEWLGGGVEFASPEGHLWGFSAHRVIGQKLAEELRPGLGGAGS